MPSVLLRVRLHGNVKRLSCRIFIPRSLVVNRFRTWEKEQTSLHLSLRASVAQLQSAGVQWCLQHNAGILQRVNMESHVSFKCLLKRNTKNQTVEIYSGDKASRQVDHQQLIPVTTTTTTESLHLREHRVDSYRCVLCQVRGHLWFPTFVFYRGDETTAGARQAVEETEHLSEFLFNEPKEEEASSKVHRKRRKTTIMYTGEDSSYCSRLTGQLGISGVPWLDKRGPWGHKDRLC